MQDSIPREPAPSGRLLVLSPHLDDAAFGCGRLLAAVPGARVATVFAGRPPPGAALTDWDRAAGFVEGEDVVGRRREEDRQALEILGARPCWLELRDSQYGGSGQAAVAAQLAGLLAALQPEAVLIPLGLFHSDHRLVHQAALTLVERYRECRWLAYEDALYRRIDGLAARAIDRLREGGFSPRPLGFAEPPDAAARKQEAVACYRSQLRALATPGRPGRAGLEDREAYWQLAPSCGSRHDHP